MQPTVRPGPWNPVEAGGVQVGDFPWCGGDRGPAWRPVAGVTQSLKSLSSGSDGSSPSGAIGILPVGMRKSQTGLAGGSPALFRACSQTCAIVAVRGGVAALDAPPDGEPLHHKLIVDRAVARNVSRHASPRIASPDGADARSSTDGRGSSTRARRAAWCRSPPPQGGETIVRGQHLPWSATRAVGVATTTHQRAGGDLC